VAANTLDTVLKEGWPDQYKRMRRSYVLLQRAADQNNYDAEVQQPDNARDILYHFCCDAWHLKDWIISESSPVSPPVKKDVWTLFDHNKHPRTTSDALMACADIANATKHLDLTQRIYTPGGPAEVTSQTQGITFPAPFPWNFGANHWTIPVGGVEHDALALAAQAIADWDTWLTGHELLPLPI
jgi:hypothetical protein